jgi:hypothetical protein
MKKILVCLTLMLVFLFIEGCNMSEFNDSSENNSTIQPSSVCYLQIDANQSGKFEHSFEVDSIDLDQQLYYFSDSVLNIIAQLEIEIGDKFIITVDNKLVFQGRFEDSEVQVGTFCPEIIINAQSNRILREHQFIPKGNLLPIFYTQSNHDLRFSRLLLESGKLTGNGVSAEIVYSEDYLKKDTFFSTNSTAIEFHEDVLHSGMVTRFEFNYLNDSLHIKHVFGHTKEAVSRLASDTFLISQSGTSKLYNGEPRKWPCQAHFDHPNREPKLTFVDSDNDMFDYFFVAKEQINDCYWYSVLNYQDSIYGEMMFDRNGAILESRSFGLCAFVRTYPITQYCNK